MPARKRAYSGGRRSVKRYRAVPLIGPLLPSGRFFSGGGGALASAVIRGRRRAFANARTAGFMGIEKKFYDKTYGAAIVATTAGAEADPAANASCLNAVAQGDGESNRDGRKIVLKSIQLRGHITQTTTSEQADINPSRVVRLLLVLDQQTNGVQLNSEDVVTSSTNVEHAYYNLQHSGRFRILYDKTFVQPVSAAGTDNANTNSVGFDTKIFKVYKSLNIPVTFDGTTEDIANITDNSLHVICFASQTGGYLEYESRLRFVG